MELNDRSVPDVRERISASQRGSSQISRSLPIQSAQSCSLSQSTRASVASRPVRPSSSTSSLSSSVSLSNSTRQPISRSQSTPLSNSLCRPSKPLPTVPRPPTSTKPPLSTNVSLSMSSTPSKPNLLSLSLKQVNYEYPFRNRIT